MKKTLIIFAMVLCLAGGLWGFSALRGLNEKARLGVGYKAKILCSEVFVAGREEADVLAQDFQNIDPLLEKIGLEVDYSAGTVTGSVYGLGKSTAYHRNGLGCALGQKGRPDDISFSSRQTPAATELSVSINPDVQTAVDAFFKDVPLVNNAPNRGVVVLQNGKIVGEGYAQGFTKDTRQQSWSMAKSVTQALVGTAVKEGWLSLEDRALMPNWQGDDPRAQITLNDMLRMNSGLHFVEDYADANSTVSQMLFGSRDMGGRAAQEALEHSIGTHWYYSSGTSNIVSKYLRENIEATGEDYHHYPANALFDKIGVSSAVFETDAAGTFVGSSFLYATARDWARMGQLYLNDGVWNGERILPEGWVDYTKSPAMDTTPYYGAHWWLNQDQMRLPDMPTEIYFMGGHDGQYVIVIPSKNIVIVRLGLIRSPANFKADVLPLIQGVYGAFDF